MTTEGFERFISGQSKFLQNYARQLQAAGYTGRQLATLTMLKKKEEEKDAT